MHNSYAIFIVHSVSHYYDIIISGISKCHYCPKIDKSLYVYFIC